MKVLNCTPNKNRPCTVTLGTFDGLHIGHIQLVKTAVDYAKKHKIDTCVFTFSANPSNSKYITSNQQREKIFASFGVDVVVLQEFSDDFKNLSPEEFFSDYIVKRLNAKMITVGFNYRFGSKGAGDIGLLSEFCGNNNIELIVVPPVLFENNVISSTRIRDCVEKADMQSASAMLGRDFSIMGTVQSGDRLGRDFGFPTANIAVDLNHVMPPQGVYLTITEYNGKLYNSITNYGGKPTIRQGVNVIETHILDFDNDIYEKTIEVKFIKKLRDIIAFTSTKELINQLNADKQQAWEVFNI